MTREEERRLHEIILEAQDRCETWSDWLWWQAWRLAIPPEPEFEGPGPEQLLKDRKDVLGLEQVILPMVFLRMTKLEGSLLSQPFMDRQRVLQAEAWASAWHIQEGFPMLDEVRVYTSGDLIELRPRYSFQWFRYRAPTQLVG